MSLINCRTPVDIGSNCRTPSIVGYEDFAPTVELQLTSGFQALSLGGSYDATEESPNFTLYIRNIQTELNFPADLIISSPTVFCSSRSYTASILGSATIAVSAYGRIYLDSGLTSGDLDPGTYNIIYSFAWTCGLNSGIFTGTLTVYIPLPAIQASGSLRWIPFGNWRVDYLSSVKVGNVWTITFSNSTSHVGGSFETNDTYYWNSGPTTLFIPGALNVPYYVTTIDLVINLLAWPGLTKLELVPSGADLAAGATGMITLIFN